MKAVLKDKELMRNIQQVIGNNIWDRIGSLQIPHHGSADNLDESALYKFHNRLRCFVSYGNTNHYGHLSDYLCNMISSKNFLFEVTENMDTIYSEKIRVYP
jgi:beta-lactamase superfamily II metal-dependent hydrolase